jgi:agmatinase
MLRAVARRHCVVGMDLVEVAPSFDAANGVTCVTAGRLILNVLAASWGPDGGCRRSGAPLPA